MDATVYKNIGRFIEIPEKTRTREEILDLNIVQIKGIRIKDAEIIKTVLGISRENYYKRSRETNKSHVSFPQ